MSVPSITVPITARDNNQQLTAELMLCPECRQRTFYIYHPEDVDHLHFQCVDCGTTFCDGCTTRTPDETIADRHLRGK